MHTTSHTHEKSSKTPKTNFAKPSSLESSHGFPNQTDLEQNSIPTMDEIRTQRKKQESFGHDHLKNISFDTPQNKGYLPFMQPKLTIGEPNNKCEQEADQVAGQVVNNINNPSRTAQKQENPEEEEVQTKSLSESQEEKVQTKPLSKSILTSPSLNPQIQRGLGSWLKKAGKKIAGGIKKVGGKVWSGIKKVGSKIWSGIKKATFIATCLALGPLAFSLGSLGWIFKKLVMEAPQSVIRWFSFGGPIRTTPAAQNIRAKMGAYETGIGINGTTASQFFSEKILDNPYVTDNMIEKMTTVSIGQIKLNKGDKEKVLKAFPNIRQEPLHKFAVSLYAMATGISPEKISEEIPDIGLTGAPEYALYKSGITVSDKIILSSGVSEGTALHDFTVDMEKAGVKGLDLRVWGVPGGDKMVSAVAMALQSGPVGAWEAACGMLWGFARQKKWL